MFTLIVHGEHRNLPVTTKFTAEQKLTSCTVWCPMKERAKEEKLFFASVSPQIQYTFLPKKVYNSAANLVLLNVSASQVKLFR